METQLPLTIYDLGFNRFLVKDTSIMELPTYLQSVFYSQNPDSIGSGEMKENLTLIAGLIQSANFDEGVSGWRMTAEGDLEANSAIFRASIVGGSLEIGTNGIHIDENGNMWWGSSLTYAGATIKISSAGVVNFTSGNFSGNLDGASGTFGTITAGVISGVTISGTINHSAGSILYQSANTSRNESTLDGAYHKKKEIVVYQPGTYRVHFVCAGSDPTVAGNVRIYKNGSAFGTDRAVVAGVGGTFDEDLAFVSGDLIQLYLKYTAGGGGQNVEAHDFRLYVSQYDSSTVNLD